VFDETEENRMLPELARAALAVLVRRLIELDEELQTLDRTLLAWHKENEASRWLAAVPGIGIVTATAIAATIDDP
jgi:transposase